MSGRTYSLAVELLSNIACHSKTILKVLSIEVEKVKCWQMGSVTGAYFPPKEQMFIEVLLLWVSSICSAYLVHTKMFNQNILLSRVPFTLFFSGMILCRHGELLEIKIIFDLMKSELYSWNAQSQKYSKYQPYLSYFFDLSGGKTLHNM